MHSTLLPYAALLPVSGDLCAAAAALLWARDYPHTTEEHSAADESLYLARRFGLDWARRTTLAVVHPWLVSAYHELGAPTSEGHDG